MKITEAPDCEIQDDQLTFTLKIYYDLPVKFSNHSEEFYIIGQNNRVRLLREASKWTFKAILFQL